MPFHAPRDARCSIHGDHAAQVTCPRCEHHVCAMAMPQGLDDGHHCVVCDTELATQHAQRLRSVVSLLTIGLGIIAAVLVMVMGTEILDGYRYGQLAMGADGAVLFEAHRDVWRLVAMPAVFVQIATIIIWCVWFARTNRCLRERGFKLEYGPRGWVWFFVPVAWWLMPYFAHRELWRASNQTRPRSTVFVVWWMTWFFSFVVNRIASALEGSEEFHTLSQAAYTGAFGSALTLVSAITAIIVVRSIYADIVRAGKRVVRHLDASSFDDTYRTGVSAPATSWPHA